MAGPYKENGRGTVWIDEEDKAKVIEKIEEHGDLEEPVFGDKFETEEIYIDTYKEPKIELTGSIEDIFISLQIPVKDNKEMRQMVKDLMSEVDIPYKETGMYIKSQDIKEVKTKTTDVAGRFNLGTEYSDTQVKVVVLKE